MRVGSDIDAICGRCGDARHVVVAMTDGCIARVECQQCERRHRYRYSGGSAAAVAPRRVGVRTGSTRPRGRAARPIVEADPDRPLRSFRTTETYAVGDRLAHPSFGEGVVQALKGVSKIEVLFEAGSKILVQGRGS